MPRQEALVTGSLVRWARQRAGFDLERGAKKLNIDPERLQTWEEETDRPTVRQAKLLAAAFRQPFAALYLPEPPALPLHLPRDYRRHAGSRLDDIPPAIRIDVERAWDRRVIALELSAARGVALPDFSASLSIRDDPEEAGAYLRVLLHVSVAEQARWRDPRIGFNTWRSRVEDQGVLVLQTSDIPVDELRAYSLFDLPLPVIVLNRKDVYPARSFSLLHELVHLALRTEGLCDLDTRVQRPPEAQRLEVFCNAVAAAVLMPAEAVRSHPVVADHDDSPEWDDFQIRRLAQHFASSRESLLRRLLTFGLTTESFYERKRAEYRAEYDAKGKAKGFVSPPDNALSTLGRPFVRLVLDNFDSGNITASDASDYLGVRLKHIPALASSLDGE